MIFRKIALIPLAVLLTAVPAFAETLNWQDIVLEARTRNPDLVSARERVNQSRADKNAVQSAFFPQVGADARAARSKNEPASARDNYSYSLSASQLIFDGFGTYADVQAAYKSIQADEYNYAVTSSNVRLDLRTAYINLLKAQDQVGLTERIAERREQSRNLIRLRYEAGREHKGSLLTSEANLSQALFEVEQAKRNIVSSQRKLGIAMGRSAFGALILNGDLEKPVTDPAKPDLENLAETTPLLRQLIVLKEASKWGVVSARSAFFPAVFLDAGTGKSGQDYPPDNRDWTVGLSVSVPIFEGGRNFAQLSRSEATAARAAADERSGRNAVIGTLEDAWKNYQDALESVEVQARFLEAGRQRSTIAESEYSTGLITFNDWIIIEDNLVRAEKAYLDARASALVAEANWKQAKGDTLEDE